MNFQSIRNVINLTPLFGTLLARSAGLSLLVLALCWLWPMALHGATSPREGVQCRLKEQSEPIDFSPGHAQAMDRKVRQLLVDILPLGDETEFYQMSAFSGALEQFGKDFEEWTFWASTHFEMDELAELDAAAIWRQTGLNEIAGIALRSDRSADHPHRFRNTSAFAFSETPQGLFSIVPKGDVADPLAAHLPDDAWVAVSLSVDLTDLFEATWNMMAAANADQLMRDWSEMQEIGPLAHLGPEFDFLPQLGELLFSGPIRYDWALRPDPQGGVTTASLGFPFGDYEVPAWEGYARMDSPGIAMLGTMDRDGGKEVLQNLLGEDGFTQFAHAIEDRPYAWRIEFPQPEEGKGGWDPEIMEVDFPAGSVRVWTSTALFEEMNGGKHPKLARNPEFLRAAGTQRTPVEIYLSSTFLQLFDEFVQEALTADSPGFPQLSAFQRYFYALFGSGEPYAWSLHRDGNVILHRSYSPGSHKSKTALAYLALPAAMIGPATDAIRDARQQAAQMQQLSQLRQIGAGVHMFMLEQNQPTATLADAWSMLEEELDPALGGTFPEFTFNLNEPWTYTYTAPDGTRFHVDHTGRVWMEE